MRVNFIINETLHRNGNWTTKQFKSKFRPFMPPINTDSTSRTSSGPNKLHETTSQPARTKAYLKTSNKDQAVKTKHPQD